MISLVKPLTGPASTNPSGVAGRDLSVGVSSTPKTKSPVVERFTVESSRRRIVRTKLIANITLEAIATGVFYPNKNPMTCATCPYQRACLALGLACLFSAFYAQARFTANVSFVKLNMLFASAPSVRRRSKGYFFNYQR